MKSLKQLGTKLGKRFKSRTFTAVFVGFGVLVVAAGTSAALTLHASQSAPETTTALTAKQTESPAAPAEAADVVNAPVDSSTSTQTSPAAPAPKPAVKPATPVPTPTPTPAPLPHVEPSVTISADGCTVTATADAGLVFLVGSYLPQHKGGHVGYLMPANQTLTRVGGAVAGFTIFGEVVDPATLQILAYKTMVTQNGTSCSGSNPDWTAPFLNYPLPPDAYI